MLRIWHETTARQITQVRATSILNCAVCLVVMALSATQSTTQSVAQDRPGTGSAFLTNAPFKESLDQSLSIAWTDHPLKEATQEISTLKRISVLIDRRLDPSTSLKLKVTKEPLRQILARAVEQQGAGISIVGNTVYLGPKSTSRRIRTVVELRQAELIGSPSNPMTGASAASTLARTARRTIQWDDLTTPTEILQQIAERQRLQIEGLDQVPHDLWAAAVLPSATTPEMLLLVLAQFELSFEWIDVGKSVRIVPLPKSPVIERSHEAGTIAATQAKTLSALVPDATVSVKGTKLVVVGAAEDHELVDAKLHPTRPVVRKPKPAATKFTFTFEVRETPLIDFLQDIERQSDYRFDYDADELEAAGVKLTRELNLKLQKATPQETFQAVFAPAGIAFEIDGTQVTLSPQPK